MKSTKVMHWGLSFIRLMVSSSSSGVIGAAFSTTDSRFTWTQLVKLLLSNFDIDVQLCINIYNLLSVFYQNKKIGIKDVLQLKLERL